MSDVVRIFIGSSANGEDADIESAYEYSIRRNCSKEVDITWMRQTNDTPSTWGGWMTERWSTPFSGFRWAIPEMCGFQGRAIYTDCDMINYRDMNTLINVEMNGKPLAARRGSRFGGHEFCVMVMDCSKMESLVIPIARQKKLPESHHRYINKFSGNSELVEDLDPRWNCLDGEDRKLHDIWQLHFTKMSTQPWKPDWFTGQPEKHPRQDIVDEFYRVLEEAKQAGFEPDKRRQEFNDAVEYNIIGR